MNYNALAYRRICLLLALAFALVLLYPLMLSPWMPIPSAIPESSSLTPPSRGLTRAFAHIAHGRIADAQATNPHALRIFGFFALQTVLRLLLAWRIPHIQRPIATLLFADIAISTTMFVVCFFSMISYTLSLL